MASIITGVSGSTVVGGGGNDKLSGDLTMSGNAPLLALKASAGNGSGTGNGADNVDAAFDLLDTVTGALRLDLLVGNAGQITTTGDAPGRGGDLATVSAFSDTVTGNAGNDLIAGDVLNSGSGNKAIGAEIGSGGWFTSYYATPLFDTADGSGGSDATVSAFDDWIGGGDGADSLVGDIASTVNATSTLTASVGSGGQVTTYYADAFDFLDVSGGSGNQVALFNDTIVGGSSDTGDVIVGDIQTAASCTAALAASVGAGGTNGGYYQSDPIENASADGGSNNSAWMFDDILLGEGGADTIIGDVSLLAGGSANLSATLGRGSESNSGDGGNDNQLVAFGDSIGGGDGNDTLVGEINASRHVDIDLLGSAGGPGNKYSRNGEVSGVGGANNQLTAFDDTLNGAAGADVAVGEVRLLDASGTLDLTSASGAFDGRGRFGTGGQNNAVASFNDSISGGQGNDTLVGEIASTNGSVQVGIAARAGDAVAQAATGGSDNVSSAASDVIQGGAGDDTIVGDVRFASGTSQLAFTASAGSGSTFTRLDNYYTESGRKGGSENSVGAGNDTLTGGSGIDFMVGDVMSSSTGTVSLVAQAGPGADTGDRHGVGDAGDGGNDNRTHAFNDQIVGGQDFDTLVGDITGGAGNVYLSATAGAGKDAYRYGAAGDGGDGNEVVAFGDSLAGGSGDDALVGDVVFRSYPSAGSSTITLQVSAGNGGDGLDASYASVGGDGGDNNTVAAFGDLLQGGSGDDSILGDISADDLQGSMTLTIEAGLDGGYAARGTGGTSNAVAAFNDRLEGGTGNDLLVGDIQAGSTPAPIDILIDGSAGNSISAFQDLLIGGDGDDRIFGDFFDGSGGFLPNAITISGDFAGRDQLFADTLRGGDGDDTLLGGLGADDMRGGDGDDTFVWSVGDLTAVAADGSPPVDRITGFEMNDTLDFRPLLASFGFTAADDANDWLSLRTEGAATVVSIDQNGSAGGAAFDDVVVLAGFTTPQTLDQLIDQDVILVV